MDSVVAPRNQAKVISPFAPHMKAKLKDMQGPNATAESRKEDLSHLRFRGGLW
jgi:hypothetical protein